MITSADVLQLRYIFSDLNRKITDVLAEAEFREILVDRDAVFELIRMQNCIWFVVEKLAGLQAELAIKEVVRDFDTMAAYLSKIIPEVLHVHGSSI